MKSNTKIKKQTKKKTNLEVVETILKSRKNKSWVEVAKILSGPRRKKISVNLDEINKKIKDNETIVIPGKVLSRGEVNKKIKIIALSFSLSAIEKLKKSKTEFSIINKEIEKNPNEKVVVWKNE